MILSEWVVVATTTLEISSHSWIFPKSQRPPGLERRAVDLTERSAYAVYFECQICYEAVLGGLQVFVLLVVSRKR